MEAKGITALKDFEEDLTIEVVQLLYEILGIALIVNNGRVTAIVNE